MADDLFGRVGTKIGGALCAGMLATSACASRVSIEDPSLDTGILVDTGAGDAYADVISIDSGADTTSPPGDTWIPPTDTSVPPADTWVPPPDTWVPPPDTGPTSPCATTAPDGRTIGVQGVAKTPVLMAGCGGSVTFDKRAVLCAAGCAPCKATEWVAMHGTTRPTSDYWTDDVLEYGGGYSPAGGTCMALAPGKGTPCTAGRPMHVCLQRSDGSGTQRDAYGNTCTWTLCGYDTRTPNHDFGGCNSNPTAGTLCCCR